MTGPAETPAGAPSGTAKAVVTLSTKTDKVCWTFKSLSGVTHPTYAHIHMAPAGKSGNIVVALSTGSKFLTKGCVPASAADDQRDRGQPARLLRKHPQPAVPERRGPRATLS